MITEKHLAAFNIDPGHKDPIEIKKALNQKVQQLLDHDLERLLHLLYRIDVNEEKFKEVLATVPADHISKAVTDLIWARCLQKLAFRNSYGKSQDS